jgi:hypothetical protein
VEFHEITGDIRVGQKLPERGIVRSWCAVFFFFISPGSEK